MHASAAPSDVVKMVSGRFPTSLLALCRSNFSCRANALLRWMYPDIHQSVMCFPDLVAASGGRIFTAFWLMENTKTGVPGRRAFMGRWVYSQLLISS